MFLGHLIAYLVIDLDNEAGYVIDLNNPELFTEKIDYLASLDDEQYSTLIQNTKNYFKRKTEKNEAILGHLKMFKKIINE